MKKREDRRFFVRAVPCDSNQQRLENDQYFRRDFHFHGYGPNRGTVSQPSNRAIFFNLVYHISDLYCII